MTNANVEDSSQTFSGERRRPIGSESVSPPGAAQILTVDDNPETQLLLRHFLSGIGKVVAAMNFDEAIEQARKRTFEIVLIDVKLDQTHSGIDLLQALRNEPSYSDVPMIACTAYALPGDRDRLLQSGFTDYVSKPFTRSQVVDVVRRYLPPSA